MSDKKYIIMGPQGSGKGTQAKTLAAKLNIKHISTGEIFRLAVLEGSELGQKVKQVIDQGILMPDDVTNALVKEKITEESGYILDGYPRTLAQAEFLDSISPDVKAIYLELNDDEAVERIAGRRSCPLCGAVYHVKYAPSQEEGVCDKCGGNLIQRNDDVPEVIRARLKTFHSQTEPLLEFYSKSGRLIKIDGMPPITEVTSNMFAALGL